MTDSQDDIGRQLLISVDQLRVEVRANKTMVRRLRNLTIGLLLSFMVDVPLTAWLYVVAHRAQTTQSLAHSECVARNTESERQLSLWHYFYTLPPAPNQTEAQKQSADQARVRIDETFRSTPCK